MSIPLIRKKITSIPHILLFFLLLSSLLRVLLLNVFLEHNSIQSFEYDAIAENIMSGKGFSFDHLGTSYKSFGPPLYSILISVLYRFTGIAVVPVICLQIILSLLTCPILFFIARRVADKYVAMTASIIYLFHPGLVLYSVKIIHSLSLDIFLFLLVILSFMRLRENMSFVNNAATGFALGIATLARPSILAFGIISVLWLFASSDRSFKTKIINIFLLISIAVIPISAWTIRNYAIHKRIIVSTTCDAEVFWRGNNKDATGASYKPDGTTVLESDKALYDKLMSLDELGKRRFFKEEALKFIKNHPDKFIVLYFKKLYYFWWFSPVSGILYPHHYFYIYRAFYTMIVLFAIIGFVNLFRKNIGDIRKNIYLLLLFLISTSLFQALYYVEGRHRWGVEPILLIFSAAGVIMFVEKTRGIVIKKSR